MVFLPWQTLILFIVRIIIIIITIIIVVINCYAESIKTVGFKCVCLEPQNYAQVYSELNNFGEGFLKINEYRYEVGSITNFEKYFCMYT